MSDEGIDKAIQLMRSVQWFWAVSSIIFFGFGCYYLYHGSYFALLAIFAAFAFGYLFVFSRKIIKAWDFGTDAQTKRFDKWLSDTKSGSN